MSLLDWSSIQSQSSNGWTVPPKPSGHISISSSDEEEIFEEINLDRNPLLPNWSMQSTEKPYSLFGQSSSFSSMPLSSSSNSSGKFAG